MARVSKTNPFRTHEQRANNEGQNQQDNQQPEPEPKAEEDKSSPIDSITTDYEEETQTEIQEKAKGKSPMVAKRGKSPKEILSTETPKGIVTGLPNNRSKTEITKPKRGHGRNTRRYGVRSKYTLKSVVKVTRVEIYFESEQIEESDVFEDSETESDEACKRMKMGPNDSDHGAGGLGGDVGGGYQVWA